MPSSNPSTPVSEKKHYNFFHDVEEFFHNHFKIEKNTNKADAKKVKEAFEDIHKRAEISLDKKSLHQHYAYAILSKQDLSKVGEIDDKHAKKYAAISAAVNADGKQSIENLSELSKIISYITKLQEHQAVTGKQTATPLTLQEKLVNLETIMKQYIQLVDTEFEKFTEKAKVIYHNFIKKAPHNLLYQEILSGLQIVDPELFEERINKLPPEEQADVQAALQRAISNNQQLLATFKAIATEGKDALENATLGIGDIAMGMTEAKANDPKAIDKFTDSFAKLSNAGQDITDIFNQITIAYNNIQATNAAGISPNSIIAKPVVAALTTTELTSMISPVAPTDDTVKQEKANIEEVNKPKSRLSPSISFKNLHTSNSAVSPQQERVSSNPGSPFLC